MIRQLPPNELEEIDGDLINHYYYINFKSNVNDLEILNTFFANSFTNTDNSRALKK